MGRLIKPGALVIARATNAGVFAGTLESEIGETVILTNARRLWQWSGAASLSELSQLGVSKPTDCKFPQEVPEVVILGVCEMVPLSAQAKATIDSVAVWTEH